MVTQIPILAVVSGADLVHQALFVLVIIVCLLLVWLAGRWAFTKPNVPPAVMIFWNGFFGLIGLILVINFLLSLVGKPFIQF